ncbi:hypothetical protein D9M71_129280 [compost metagenome]
MRAGQLVAGLDQQADGGRRGVPDADLLASEDAVPAHRVEVGAVDHAGDAEQQRGEDAVGGAGDPAGIGGAPEHVVRVQVEGVPGGDQVGQRRAVHVQRALGRAGGAAGEVQQRGAVGGGRCHRKVVADLVQQLAQVVGVGDLHRAAVVVEQQHMPEQRQLVADCRDLAPVQGFAGQQHAALAEAQAGLQRLRAEGGEQRRHHAAGLEAAEHAEVQLQAAVAQHEQPRAGLDAEVVQHVGEAAGLPRQLAVADLAATAVAQQQAQGDVFAQGTGGMPVDRLEGQVEAAAGQTGQPLGFGLPREGSTRLGRCRPVGRYPQCGGSLVDAVSAHGVTPCPAWAARVRARPCRAPRSGSPR